MKTITDKPDLYDLLYDDVVEDVAMYLNLLKNSKDILELGCGTGRITIPLANDNHYIEAVDLADKMLDKLRIKIRDNINLRDKISVVLGNMCDYKSIKKFDAIVLPLTTFNYLLTEEEQIECLRTIDFNLKDDGFAIIELLSEKTFLETNKMDDFVYIKNILESDNSYYEYYRKTKLEMDDRRISQLRLFKYYFNDALISEDVLEWNNRFVTVEDFEKLLLNTSLCIEKVYGNCQLDDYSLESEDVFIKVRRKKNGE